MNRIVVTGTRKTRQAMRDPLFCALEKCLATLGPDMTVAHGAHPGGVDAYARRWARRSAKRGVMEDAFPLCGRDWQQFGKGAGPWRNRRMLRPGAALLLAAPLPDGAPEGPSTGTHDCARAAEELGVPVCWFPFDDLTDLLLMLTNTEEVAG